MDALTFWELPYSRHCYLPELPSLSCLTFVDCDLTGKDFPLFPAVTELTLIDCSNIVGKGLQPSVRKALPSLKAVAVQMTPATMLDLLKLSLDALNVLHLGENLQSIDSKGVNESTHEHVSSLCGYLQ